jgi:hypothetical protein
VKYHARDLRDIAVDIPSTGPIGTTADAIGYASGLSGNVGFPRRRSAAGRRSAATICNMEIVMRRLLAALATGLALVLCQLTPSLAQAPDAIIELSGGSVAAGIGFSWGSGTLIFQGRRYPLTVDGISLASVGVTQYTAAGSVTGLKTPQGINGVFTAVAAGGTLGGGGSVSAMQNQNGVVIQMTSTTQGLSLTLAAAGVKIQLAQ